jgi:hypothetical protein
MRTAKPGESKGLIPARPAGIIRSMTRSLFPIIAALVYPFALLLFVPAFPLIKLALLSRAAPPGAVPVLSLSSIPSAGRSPPIL